MLDRDKISFWTRVGAIALAVVFLGSFVFFSVGTSLNYSILDLFGSRSKGQEEPTSGASEQIARAQQDLQADPENPKIMKRLASLYLENGQTDSAVEMLENARGVAPEDPAIPLSLGQAYDRKAQGVADEEKRKAAYQQAGDAYAAATEIRPDSPQAYLLAGQDYDQAGEKSKAIRYWNGYLKLQPEGEQADAVKERIDNLLKGEETTGGTQGAKKQ